MVLRKLPMSFLGAYVRVVIGHFPVFWETEQTRTDKQEVFVYVCEMCAFV